MTYETILREQAGPVMTLTLNRPDALNALNPQMTRNIPLSAMAHASYDDERGQLLEAMRTGGLKNFLEARDGPFRPEPFGPKSRPK